MKNTFLISQIFWKIVVFFLSIKKFMTWSLIYKNFNTGSKVIFGAIRNHKSLGSNSIENIFFKYNIYKQKPDIFSKIHISWSNWQKKNEKDRRNYLWEYIFFENFRLIKKCKTVRQTDLAWNVLLHSGYNVCCIFRAMQ